MTSTFDQLDAPSSSPPPRGADLVVQSALEAIGRMARPKPSGTLFATEVLDVSKFVFDPDVVHDCAMKCLGKPKPAMFDAFADALDRVRRALG